MGVSPCRVTECSSSCVQQAHQCMPRAQSCPQRCSRPRFIKPECRDRRFTSGPLTLLTRWPHRQCDAAHSKHPWWQLVLQDQPVNPVDAHGDCHSPASTEWLARSVFSITWDRSWGWGKEGRTGPHRVKESPSLRNMKKIKINMKDTERKQIMRGEADGILFNSRVEIKRWPGRVEKWINPLMILGSQVSQCQRRNPERLRKLWCGNRIVGIREIPWWFSGWDSVLSLSGPRFNHWSGN